jgi:hypothetical protein
MDDKDLGVGKTCFVVTPIGDKLEPVGTDGRLSYEQAITMWEAVFEPACDSFGLTAIRADKVASPGEIPKQVFTFLRDADVVIADVSGGNANVMYELGLRHTKDKLTIQVGEHQRLPFDVNTIRTIKFKRTDAGLIDARNALIEALRAGLTGNYSPVTATEVWGSEGAGLSQDEVISAAAASVAPDEDVVYDDEQPGRLELLATGEAALGRLSEHLESFGAEMNELGELTVEHTEPMGKAATFAQKLTAVRIYVESLGPTAENMDRRSDEFLTDVRQADTMIQIVVKELRTDGLPTDPSERDSTTGFLESMSELAQSAAEARPSMSEFRKTFRDLRRQSKQLVAVSKSVEQSVTRVISAADIIIGWGTAADEILSEEPGKA